jgi:rare lipoprotein A
LRLAACADFRAVAWIVVAAFVTGCAQAPVTEVPAPSAPAILPSSTPPPAAAPPPATAPPAAQRETPFTERGRISHYGAAFSGKTTANGERFDPEALTMAHRTLPFGTLVRITNLENKNSVEVKVNDRGPYVAGRVADVSLAAARKLGMVNDGVVEATLQVIEPAAD